MHSTRLSLLRDAKEGDLQAWERLVGHYQPWIHQWLSRQGIAHHDAEELAQDVMEVVVRELNRFDHGGRTGAFRRWLKVITVHRAKGHWRTKRVHAQSPGGSVFLATLEQLADPHSRISADWDLEHDRHVLRWLFAELENDFDSKTLQAFRMLALEGHNATTVAAQLHMSVGAVYSAKSRVLRRLRHAAAGLVDDGLIS